MNIVNCSSFFLLELEELKSCKYRKETANAAMRLYWFSHHLLVLLETSSTKRVCNIYFVTRVWNHFSMHALHNFGVRIYNGKSFIIKSWNIVRRKKPRYQYLSSGIRLIIRWTEALSVLEFFSNNTKLVNCNWRHSFSQFNEFKKRL